MTDLNVTDERITIFNHLIETGCCKRCTLRLLGEDANYDNPEDDVKRFISDNSERNGHDEHKPKKTKSNPCIVCLDLLQDETLQNMILKVEIEKILQYDCDTFVNYISFPAAFLIREHSIIISLKEKFPSFFKDPHIIALNKVWSLSIQNKLAEKIGKKFDKNSSFQIQFTMNYESGDEECSDLCNIENKTKKTKSHKDALSKNVIGEHLQKIHDDKFRKHIPVPPEAPTKPAVVHEVLYKHEFIFIAGRYCKYARNIFQTPWLIDDECANTTSVQQIIFQPLEKFFDSSSLVFSASGREDFDVRTLGRGRPFFIKVCDPKITKISFEMFRSIEEEIKKSKVVKVQDLQFIDKKYINNIKEGEQFKRKTYRALCIVSQPEELETYIIKINRAASITLKQKTPLRVFHRRSADVRERVIYTMSAKAIPGKCNLFELKVLTQAGTYVKEFVHGDLGRTRPSLGDIIGCQVDIVALDVLDIHIDFPPSVVKLENDEDIS